MHRQQEFAQIVLAHQAQLRMFVRMLGVAPHAVDDLAQDVFVVAYQRWDTLDTAENAAKWLRGIARNLVRNELRKQSRRQKILNTALTESLMQVEDPRSDGWQEDGWLDALRACLAKLPPQSRELVAARYERDAASGELAEELGTTADAVRQTLLRIRRQLKTCIEGQLGETRE
ncbi:MAG: sigma-70 family RNA polymerase sigma factor [Pirellulales bacterium]